MRKAFKRGDHVEWNSEAGRVRGIILKKVTADYNYMGYVYHATKEAPQYLMQSDNTDHVAIHKGAALKLLKPRATKRYPVRKKSHRRLGSAFPVSFFHFPQHFLITFQLYIFEITSQISRPPDLQFFARYGRWRYASHDAIVVAALWGPCKRAEQRGAFHFGSRHGRKPKPV